MGLPAFVLPERWVVDGLPAGVDRDALERLRPARVALVDRVRSTRPADGSDDETAALVDLARFGASMSALFGTSLVPAWRHAVEVGMRDLLAEELGAADTDRKLALRRLEQALDTFGVLLESFARALGELSDASVAELMAEAMQVVEDEGIAPEVRTVLRFELDLLMAFESLGGALDELTHWAFRAAVGARKVQALPSPGAEALRGEIARLRARTAWQGWDDDEIAEELRPWPSTDPSR
jgi:hypothetical protein